MCEKAGDLNGLALDCASRRVLGEDVEIAVTVWDDTNTRIRPDAIIAAVRAAGGHGIVGVQTNQYPRAVQHRAPPARCGDPGVHWRVSRERMPGDAARDAGGADGGDGTRHHPVRRRGGGEARRVAPGRRSRRAAAALQLHEPVARDRGHAVGTLTYAGYILGFPGDTPASIERDIGIIQRELPIDILEFFILAPLPGSADHKTLHLAGVEMDRDMNRYDLAHVTTRHPKMGDAELLGIYRKAWDLYYSPAHVETVLRRAKAWGYDPHNMMWKLLSFHAPPLLEKVHPLEGGIFRRKYRRDRRPQMGRESPLVFYPRTLWEIVSKHARFAAMYWRYRRTLRRVQRDTGPHSDLAMTPPRSSCPRATRRYRAAHPALGPAPRLPHVRAAFTGGAGHDDGDVRIMA